MARTVFLGMRDLPSALASACTVEGRRFWLSTEMDPSSISSIDPTSQLAHILSFKPTFPATAKFIYEVLCIFDSADILVPQEYQRT